VPVEDAEDGDDVDVDVADEEVADGEAGFVLPALETKLATGGPGKVYVAEASNT
jgi:hypothetical protein